MNKHANIHVSQLMNRWTREERKGNITLKQPSPYKYV